MKEVSPYLVQVVLFVDLSLQLAVHGQSQEVRILLARSQGRVEFSLTKHLLEVVDGFASCSHLTVDGVLEVPRKVLDLLYFLVEVTAKTSQSQYDVLFDLACLVRLLEGKLVVIPQDLEGIVEATAL